MSNNYNNVLAGLIFSEIFNEKICMRNFKDFSIWRNGLDLSLRIYEITEQFQNKERFGLVSQMRRVAISIPSNIAEGCSRSSKKELVRFLEISLGSAFELETQILLTIHLDWIKKATKNS